MVSWFIIAAMDGDSGLGWIDSPQRRIGSRPCWPAGMLMRRTGLPGWSQARWVASWACWFVARACWIGQIAFCDGSGPCRTVPRACWVGALALHGLVRLTQGHVEWFTAMSGWPTGMLVGVAPLCRIVSCACWVASYEFWIASSAFRIVCMLGCPASLNYSAGDLHMRETFTSILKKPNLIPMHNNKHCLRIIIFRCAAPGIIIHWYIILPTY